MRPAWLTAVIDSKKEAGKGQNLSGNRKHEFTTKHKHRIKEGHLEIIVMKARNIHPKTFSSELDPYVQFIMGEQKARSGIASRHGLTVKGDPNPEWDWGIGRQIGQNKPKIIKFEVFDKQLGRSIPLGYTTLSIRTLLQTNQGECLLQWFPLDGCTTGEILLATKFFPRQIRPIPKFLQTRIHEIAKTDSVNVCITGTINEVEPSVAKEPDRKEKQHTTKLEAVQIPKTEAGKGQDLDASELSSSPPPVPVSLLSAALLSANDQCIQKLQQQSKLLGQPTITLSQLQEVIQDEIYIKSQLYDTGKAIRAYLQDQKLIHLHQHTPPDQKQSFITQQDELETKIHEQYVRKSKYWQNALQEPLVQEVWMSDVQGLKLNLQKNISFAEYLQWQILNLPWTKPQLLNLIKLMKQKAETRNDDKKEKDTAKVQAVEAPKTNAGKMQDLDATERPESAATLKHSFEAGQTC